MGGHWQGQGGLEGDMCHPSGPGGWVTGASTLAAVQAVFPRGCESVRADLLLDL